MIQINVLIDEFGRARLSDFALLRLVDEVRHSYRSSSKNYADLTSHVQVRNVGESEGSGNYRWLAPEILESSSALHTKASDVWSFGMLCLELLSNEPPYSHHTREPSIILDIARGRLPERPRDARNLTDPIWELLQRCWQMRPEARPTITEVLSALESLLSPLSPGMVLSLVRVSSRGVLDKYSHTIAYQTPSPSLHAGSSSALPSPAVYLDITNENWPLPPDTYTGSERHHPASQFNLYPSETLLSPTSPSAHSHITSHTNSTQTDLHDLESFPSSDSHNTGHSPLSSTPSVNGMSSGTPKYSTRFQVPKFGRSSASSSKAYKSPKAASRPSTTDANFAQPPILSFPFKYQKSSLYSSSARPSTAQSDPYAEYGSSSPRTIDPGSPPRRSSEDYPPPEEYATLLQRALEDPEPIYIERDGFVEAGTLWGLVERLLKESTEFSGDLEFRAMFLACYRAFTTSENVFDVLERKFESEDQLEVQEGEPDHRTNARYA